MPHLSAIWTYPIKSIRGVFLSETFVQPKGIQHDRRWMLIDAQNQFVTQRNTPQMALIRLQIAESQLILEAPAMQPLNIPIDAFAPDMLPIQVKIWEDECWAVGGSKEADQWFSEFLKTNFRLVYMPDFSERQVDTKYAPIGTFTGFSDGFPFLLIAEASLQDLNSRLVLPVEMQRFRPNLVVSDTEPYEEDKWKMIRIGEAIFEIAKPCARCVMTTIHPETAQQGKEPLRTLATYRQIQNKIMFGQNLILKQVGRISLQDTLEILH